MIAVSLAILQILQILSFLKNVVDRGLLGIIETSNSSNFELFLNVDDCGFLGFRDTANSSNFELFKNVDDRDLLPWLPNFKDLWVTLCVLCFVNDKACQ
jgi:hypothetical protein